MIEEYFFDGEIHPISSDFAYICEKVDGPQILENFDDYEPIRIIKKKFINKYIDYLLKHDREMLIDMITSEYPMKNFTLIYRPPWVISCLAQFGTFALKFKRSRKDNL